jgi:hypothetical protein
VQLSHTVVHFIAPRKVARLVPDVNRRRFGKKSIYCATSLTTGSRFNETEFVRRWQICRLPGQCFLRNGFRIVKVAPKITEKFPPGGSPLVTWLGLA